MERHHATSGGLYTLQRRPRRLLGLAGRRRDLRKIKDDTQDDCHARHHAPQCTSYTVRPLHPRDSGEIEDFHDPLLMYTAPPCDYKRRRRASFRRYVGISFSDVFWTSATAVTYVYDYRHTQLLF